MSGVKGARARPSAECRREWSTRLRRRIAPHPHSATFRNQQSIGKNTS